MKKTALLTLLLSAASAAAAQMLTNDLTGEVSAWPPPAPANVYNAGYGYHESKGWRWFDAAAQAGWDAARAAERAEAEAEAEAWASMPAEFPNGIAVKDEAGHWLQLVAVTNQAPPVMLQVSESPISPEKHDAMMASNSAAWRKKFDAAKSGTKGQIQDRASRIESLLGVGE